MEENKDKSRKKSNSKYYVTRLRDILDANKFKLYQLANHLGISTQTVYNWFSEDSEPMWFSYAFGIIDFLYHNIDYFNANEFFEKDFNPNAINELSTKLATLNKQCEHVKKDIQILEKKKEGLTSATNIKLNEELINKIKKLETEPRGQNYSLAKHNYMTNLYDDVANQLKLKNHERSDHYKIHGNWG